MAEGQETQTPGTDSSPPISTVEAALEKTKLVFDPDLHGGPGKEEGTEEVGKGEEAPPEKKAGEEYSQKKEAKPEETPGEREGKPPEEKKGLEEPADKTDKRVADAQRMAHEKADEAARLRKELDQERQEKLELQKQISERAAQISEEAEEEIMQKALEEMQEIDPGDPEYLKKMSKTWTKTLREFRKLDSASLKKATKEVVTEEFKTREAATTKETEERRVWEDANSKAMEAGLEMEDAGWDEEGKAPVRSDDYKLFWHLFAPQAPKNLDRDAKVEWIIKEVKGFKKRMGVKPKDDKVEKKQLANQPLGRGGAPPGKASTEDTPARPPTMEDALSKMRERNTI